MKRIVALASGAGTNFSALVDAVRNGQIRASIEGLIADRPDTGAARTAKGAGIPVTEINYGNFDSRAAFDAVLLSRTRAMMPDLVVALGFMRILAPQFIEAMPQRIINVHPSLLPAFPGMNAQKQAIDYGARVSGVTVHLMDAGVDSGPILLQKAAEIPQGCSVEELRFILRPLEHELVIKAVALFCEGRIKVDRRRVYFHP